MPSTKSAHDFGYVAGKQFPRWLSVSAWVSFVLNVVIIGTGGAVRLTGSGLGCSEWPLCTPESLVPTPELGIHGLIEFGNRTITGLLVFAALAVLLPLLHSVGGRRLLTLCSKGRRTASAANTRSPVIVRLPNSIRP